MDLLLDINGRRRQVSIEPEGACFRVTIDGRARTVEAAPIDASTLSLVFDGEGRQSHEVGMAETGARGEWAVHFDQGMTTVRVVTNGARGGDGRGTAATGVQQVVAPMPGKVIKVLVAPGDEVKARQGLVVIEAMKMENELRSPKDGRVREVATTEGASVEAGRLLVVIE
jgi:biotin carboxyl carrier protein